MIPKKIHYCWFGRGAIPERLKNFMSSWHKYMPDYEIKEWNEDNFDINSNQYVKEAYEARKLAFVADYVRLYALAKEGGIYMDADVEVLRPLDRFLNHTAFTGYEELGGRCLTGTMGSVAGGKWVSDLLAEYDNRKFVLPDGSFNQVTNVEYVQHYMKSQGVIIDGEFDNKFQDVPGLVTLYPKDFFCVKNTKTRKVEITENSYTIHHFTGSWNSKQTLLVKWVTWHFGLTTGRCMSLLLKGPFYSFGRIWRYLTTGK